MVEPEAAKSAKAWDPEALVSPRAIAAAIGASESSLRRWIDNGDIRISRTAGGHRRVPLQDAVQFIRKIGAVVVNPGALHLPPFGIDQGLTSSSDDETLAAALCEGRRESINNLLLNWYLQGRTLHELFDGPVRGAMQRVGELWKHDDRGILVEHRATDICLGAISALRALLPKQPESAPLALGAAPEGDPYQIPSLMAGTVLAEAGLREINFGANTPLELLGREAVATGARLVWLSVSTVADARLLNTQLKRLAGVLAERDIRLVIGGHGSADIAGRKIPNAFPIRSMGELAAFGKGLVAQTVMPAR